MYKLVNDVREVARENHFQNDLVKAEISQDIRQRIDCKVVPDSY